MLLWRDETRIEATADPSRVETAWHDRPIQTVRQAIVVSATAPAAAKLPEDDDSRAVGAYLRSLRTRLVDAADSRRAWLGQVGQLLRERYVLSPDDLAATGRRIGQIQLRDFRSLRAQVSILEPPDACAPCHDAVVAWLDKQAAACEVLTELGEGGAIRRLREVVGLITESRADARRFSREIADLVSGLQRGAAAERARARPARVPRPRPQRGGRRPTATALARVSTPPKWARVARWLRWR